MSFPAAGGSWQSWYRNSIETVRDYIVKTHGEGNYHVFNCSGTPYDKNALDGRVTDFDWEDHHSPTLLLLFEACQ